jgi:hypothetical protein
MKMLAVTAACRKDLTTEIKPHRAMVVQVGHAGLAMVIWWREKMRGGFHLFMRDESSAVCDAIVPRVAGLEDGDNHRESVAVPVQRGLSRQQVHAAATDFSTS